MQITHNPHWRSVITQHGLRNVSALPLTLLHVLDKEKYPASADLSGNIGLGSREHLLEELATLDAQRAKLALEHGQHMLEKARERKVHSGAMSPDMKQRHGHLVESLCDLQDDNR